MRGLGGGVQSASFSQLDGSHFAQVIFTSSFSDRGSVHHARLEVQIRLDLILDVLSKERRQKKLEPSRPVIIFHLYLDALSKGGNLILQFKFVAWRWQDNGNLVVRFDDGTRQEIRRDMVTSSSLPTLPLNPKP